MGKRALAAVVGFAVVELRATAAVVAWGDLQAENPRQVLHRVMARAVTCWAGPAAVAKREPGLRRNGDLGFRKDFAEVEELCEGLAKAFPSQPVGFFACEVRAGACRLLDAKWPQVEAVAEALWRAPDRRLTGAQVRAIMAEAEGVKQSGNSSPGAGRGA